MSDVVTSLCMVVKRASLVLATLIPVLLGAPITSLPEVQQPSDALDTAAVAPNCQNDFYLDRETEQCLPCVLCPMGMGSTAWTCGDGNGEKGVCEDCVDGETFQDQTTTKGRCNTCRMCDLNASVLTNCTKHSDTQCGPCNEGYGQYPDLPELCSPCKHLNDYEKPPECLMITPTPTPPVTAPDTDECVMNQNSCDTSVSTCHNTIGSYRCECLSGYVKNSLDKCVDINECESPDSCNDSNSRCSNTNGSYTCDCLPGFEMDSSSQCIGNSSTGTNIVAIGAPLGILGPVLVLFVLAVIWLRRNRCKGEKASATQMTTVTASQDEGQMQESNPAQSTDDSGRTETDGTTSATSDSPQAVTNSNSQSLPPASQEELESLLGGKTSLSEEVVEPNTDTDVNDDRALTGVQRHDSPTANGNIFNHTPSTGTDVNPFPLSTEESASSDETRDDLGPLEKIGGEGRSTTVRPGFNRSQSVPAKTSNENTKGEDKTFPILPENTQKNLVEMEYKDRENKCEEEFQKALVLGKVCQWKNLNLLFRTRVNKMMKTENKERDFKAFGELMGLNRNTDLKDCSDLNSVFTQLEESLQTEVFMDKALVTLRKMKRNDIVREIMKEIINKKPTCRMD